MGWLMSRTFDDYINETIKAIAYPKSGIIAAVRTGLGSPPVSKGIASAFFNLTQVIYLKQLDELSPDTIDETSTLGRLLKALPTKDEERNKKSKLFEPNEKNRLYQEKNGSLNLVNVFQMILARLDVNDPTDKLKIILDILYEVFASIAPVNQKAALKPFKSAIHQFAREIQGIADEEIKSIKITPITAKNKDLVPQEHIATLEQENLAKEQRIQTLEQLKKTDFECRLFDTQKLTNKLTQQHKELQQLNSVHEIVTELKSLFVTNANTFQQAVKNLITQIEQDIQTAETVVNGNFSFSITGATLLSTLQALLPHLNELMALKPSPAVTAHIMLIFDNINTTLGDIPSQLTQTNTQRMALATYLASKNSHNTTLKDDEDPSRNHQAYHVIPRNQTIALGYEAELNSTDLDPLTDNETYDRKKKSKNRLKWLATVNSLVVAIGQGMIPFVFAIGPAGLALALTIGIAGTLCNFFLFRGDAYGVLKDLRFGTFFKGNDGQPLSKNKKRWVWVGLIFAALSALTTGLLTFMSTKAGIIKLCLLFGFASGPAAPIVIGVLIAGLTTFALGFVFTQIVTKWIREDTLQKLWRNLTWHNIKNYFEPPKYLQTKKQRYEYIAKQILNIILTPIAVAVAIAVSAVVVGIFSRQSAAVFSSIDTSIRISHAISTLLIGTVGTVINALNIIFYAKAIVYLKNAVVGISLTVGKGIIHPINTIKAGAAWLAGKTKSAETTVTTAPAAPSQKSTRTIGDILRMIARASSVTKIISLLVAIVFNAMGQGDGATPANSLLSPFAYARSLRFIDPNSLVGGSFSVNAKPGIAVCEKDTAGFNNKITNARILPSVSYAATVRALTQGGVTLMSAASKGEANTDDTNNDTASFLPSSLPNATCCIS